MTDHLQSQFAPVDASGDPVAAGARLRAAREAQGLSLDDLAATLKVAVSKLAALEAGDLERLPDANFARALAKAVCRQLQVDPAPVLSSLPVHRAASLGQAREPLNQPFKERTRGVSLFDRASGASSLGNLFSFRWLAPAVLLIAALVIYLLPERVEWPVWWPRTAMPSAPSAASAPPAEMASEPVFPPASAGSEPASASSDPVPTPLTSDSAQVGAASAVVPLTPADAASAVSAGTSPALPVAPEAPAIVGLQVKEDAWVEVRDGTGRKVFSRLLKAGETAAVDGTPPLRLRIGNAQHVQLRHRGEPVDLSGYIRGNIARLELQ